MEKKLGRNQALVLPNGDILELRGRGMVLNFQGARRVLHTSVAGGGIRYDLKSLFNFDLKDENGRCELREATYERELIRIASELRLEPEYTAGMTTAVTMDDVVIEIQESDQMFVAAIVTAGIENNGGYPGDVASYREENDGFVMIGGTINTMVMIGADLPDGILCRAAVTATEAKAAAIGELRLPSVVSEEIATGSGTDGLAVICDPSSPLRRTDAGKHSLLGELIGDTVRIATKNALLRHMKPIDTDMTKMSNRLKRFGITLEGFRQYVAEHAAAYTDVDKVWHDADKNPDWAAKASMAAAIMDDIRHGIFSPSYGLSMLKRQLFPSSEETDSLRLWYEALL